MKKYVLNPYLKCILCSEDEILVRHGIRSRFSMVIEDPNKKRLLGKIIKYFKQPISLEELISKELIKKENYEDTKSLIELLYQKKVLVSPSEDIVNIYLKDILSGKSDLSSYRIGVIGVGYLGSRNALQFLKLGIENILLLDERKVKNPEIEGRFFNIPIEGLKKDISYIEIFKEYTNSMGFKNVKGINSAFQDEERLKEIFENSDIVVVSLETFSPLIFHSVNRLSISLKKPWVSIWIDGSLGIIGPIYIPGETCCYSEFEIQSEAAIKLKDEYFLYKEFMEEEGFENANLVIPPYLDIVSSFSTSFIMYFLLKRYSPILGRAIFIDFEELSIDYQQVMKLPRCPACREIEPAYKHTFV